MSNSDKITDLAHECANDVVNVAIEPDRLDIDGPLPADWRALKRCLDREPTDEERKAFADAYRGRLRELLNDLTAE